jgi:ABC-type nitrate/sulfonate/bicarbonate transport system ATPase subunit
MVYRGTQLRCRGACVSYAGNGGKVEALRNISLETGRNEFLSILGPSGCGKTTLLRVLAGLVVPQQGTVERISPQAAASGRILLVRQENSLFPWMTVLENAAFGMEVQGVDRKDRNARAMHSLARFGLAGRERDYPRELSLGMKQRVAVIRSFLSEPAVLLMDEPFAALDCQTRMALHADLLELWEQDHRTVVFVTHDVEEAVLLSDRILVLSPQPGTIIAEFSVPFPRPRSVRLALDDEFLSLKRRIFSCFGPALAEAPLAS